MFRLENMCLPLAHSCNRSLLQKLKSLPNVSPPRGLRPTPSSPPALGGHAALARMLEGINDAGSSGLPPTGSPFSRRRGCSQGRDLARVRATGAFGRCEAVKDGLRALAGGYRAVGRGPGTLIDAADRQCPPTPALRELALNRRTVEGKLAELSPQRSTSRMERLPALSPQRSVPNIMTLDDESVGESSTSLIRELGGPEHQAEDYMYGWGLDAGCVG